MVRAEELLENQKTTKLPHLVTQDHRDISLGQLFCLLACLLLLVWFGFCEKEFYMQS